ncbi:MAG: MFS transporter, partial [Lachnospiraceae bacterium]|nr:MFS transporter [Lachnospiraceae bacterium]
VEVTTEAKKEDKTKTGAGDLVRSLLQNPPLLALMVCDLAKFMFNFVCMGAAIYYFTYVANNKGFMSKYILISNVLCVIAAYCFKYLAKAISARTTAIVTFIVMAIACFIAYFNFQNMMFVVVFMSIAQFGYGIAYAATPALYADTVVYSEWKTGKNAAGWISGLQNVPLKVAILTRGIIISAGLAMGNFNPDIDPAAASMELKKGVCMAFIVIPAIALVIAAVVMLFGFRLTKDKVVQYQNEIAARNA